MPRPCKLDTKYFNRVIGDAERTTLLTAGAGDLTQGFHFLLALYGHLHAQGFRPTDSLSNITILRNATDLDWLP
jgi:hypothetical protein